MSSRVTAQYSHSATIQEIFSGIQGEGLWVGVRQIFVRFHGCHLSCAYCDTPASRGERPATCVFEPAAGIREMASLPNPVTASVLLEILCQLQRSFPHHSVSLTGGEPLLQQPFLDGFLPLLHAAGFRSFLETNGLLPDMAASLVEFPHIVSMDMKLPFTADIAPQWERHAAFLDTMLMRLGDVPLHEHLQVKLGFGEYSLEDIERAVQVIAACHTEIPCILQPVTPRPAGPGAPRPETVLHAQAIAARILRDVRVIPQTHVMLGQW